MKRTSTRMAVVLLATSFAAACTTMGVGTGATPAGKSPVAFAWDSHSAVTGTMAATLEDTGQTFTGRYVQLTSETRVDELEPLWRGWYRANWYGWPYWSAEYSRDFVTYYSGRVEANLGSATGQHMRCDFRLARPTRGMAGGGTGRCQLPTGETIDATFPPA